MVATKELAYFIPPFKQVNASGNSEVLFVTDFKVRARRGLMADMYQPK